MAIPRYDEIQHPLLRYLADGTIRKKSDLEPPMAAHFALTESERTEEYESKNGAVFYDRVSWALSYLSLSGMLSRPKRAHYQITELGRRYVDDPDGMRAEVDRRIAERESTRPKTDPSVPIASPQPPSIDPNAEQTPQEALYRAAESIRANLCDDILATILGKTPRAFEQLVAQLLQRMG